MQRRSKDKKVNRESRILLEFIENKEWGIFNGTIRGDEEEFTFTGWKENRVIDRRRRGEKKGEEDENRR